MMNHLFKAGLTVGAVALSLTACTKQEGDAQRHEQPAASAMFETPQSISAEHHKIHEVLAAATKEDGALGDRARDLEAVLGPHFQREEEIATPPLGLLRPLATGAATADMRAVLSMTDALESGLPEMLKEHEAIGAANAALRDQAVVAGREDLVRFSDTLAAHARQEEEILYPAAILVGRHVKATAPAK